MVIAGELERLRAGVITPPSSGRRGRAQQLFKPSFQEGPGLSPNRAGVLTRPGLRIGDGHRRLVLPLVPPPPEGRE